MIDITFTYSLHVAYVELQTWRRVKCVNSRETTRLVCSGEGERGAIQAMALKRIQKVRAYDFIFGHLYKT